ncbi:uncharacterized protein ACBT57_023253 isoform 8-T18 [Dama dama]
MMSGSRCCEPGGKEETWRAIVTAQCVLCHHLKASTATETIVHLNTCTQPSRQLWALQICVKVQQFSASIRCYPDSWRPEM